MIKRLDETGAERIHPSGAWINSSYSIICDGCLGVHPFGGPCNGDTVAKTERPRILRSAAFSGKHSSGVSAAYDFFFFADGSDFEPSVFELPDPELSDLVSFFSSFLPPESLESPFEDDPAEDFLA